MTNNNLAFSWMVKRSPIGATPSRYWRALWVGPCTEFNKLDPFYFIRKRPLRKTNKLIFYLSKVMVVLYSLRSWLADLFIAIGRLANRVFVVALWQIWTNFSHSCVLAFKITLVHIKIFHSWQVIFNQLFILNRLSTLPEFWLPGRRAKLPKRTWTSSRTPGSIRYSLCSNQGAFR